jgi:hypothetical protein
MPLRKAAAKSTTSFAHRLYVDLRKTSRAPSGRTGVLYSLRTVRQTAYHSHHSRASQQKREVSKIDQRETTSMYRRGTNIMVNS